MMPSSHTLPERKTKERKGECSWLMFIIVLIFFFFFFIGCLFFLFFFLFVFLITLIFFLFCAGSTFSRLLASSVHFLSVGDIRRCVALQTNRFRIRRHTPIAF